MTYHEAIIELLYFIISKGKEYIRLLDSGNAYDKIIRNYHQFNSSGVKVYRNNKARKYYRFSEAAWRSKKKCSDLYFEHLIPVSIIKNELKDAKTKEEIKAILDRNEVVVLTSKQAKNLDKVYKDKMPENGLDRLEAFGIKIHPVSKKNHLGL